MKGRLSWLVLGAILLLLFAALQQMKLPNQDSTPKKSSEESKNASAPTPALHRKEDSASANLGQEKLRSPLRAIGLFGAVTDERDNPVVNASLILLDKKQQTLSKTRSSDSGSFFFAGFMPEEQSILAEAPDFEEGLAFVDKSGPISIRLKDLYAPCWISGLVKLETGVPPDSFKISVFFQRGIDTMAGPNQFFQNTEGMFRIAIPLRDEEQRLGLLAIAKGFKPENVGPLTLRRGDSLERIEIVLKDRSFLVSGHVFDEIGTALEGVTILSFNELGGEEGIKTSNAQGYFEFSSIRGKTIQKLVLQKAGYAPLSFLGQGLQTNDSWENLILTMGTGGFIEGFVSNRHGQAQSGEELILWTERENGLPGADWLATTVSDSSGKYRFDFVPQGNLCIARSDEKGNASQRIDIRKIKFPKNGQIQEDFIVLSNAKIQGQLSFPEDSEMFPWIELREIYGDLAHYGSVLARSECGQNTLFELDCVSPGFYLLRVFIGPDFYLDREVEVYKDRHDLGVLSFSKEEFSQAYRQRRILKAQEASETKK